MQAFDSQAAWVITVATGIADREANMWHFAAAALELLEAAVRETAAPGG